MSNNTLEKQAHSIVLIGDFNPKIFQPAWFGKQKLIREKEVENAEIKIIHQDVTAFNLDWMELTVTREKFIINTTQEPYYEVIKDLAESTFTVLEHTPLRYLGINIVKHFKLKNETIWHNIGHKLAPKDIWKKTFKNPGLRSITIEESGLDDRAVGYIRVKVEPSNSIITGIFLEVNDHYGVEDEKSSIGAKKLVEILQTHWVNSTDRSNYIIDTVLEEA